MHKNVCTAQTIHPNYLHKNVSNIASFGCYNFLRFGSKNGSGHLVAEPLVISE